MGLAGGCATPCKPLGVSCDFPMYVKSCGTDYEIVTVCDKATGLPLIAVVGIDNETGLPTSLVYNLNGTPFVGTTVSCSFPFEIEYQIVCQNGVTQFTRGDIWKDGVPTGLHFYLNALGAVVATPAGVITVGSCPLPAEIDQESVDWNPICVNGVQYYFADNYNFNNVLSTRTFQPTLYKLGDNGAITTTRPTGTFIQGYCPSLSWTESLCDSFTSPDINTLYSAYTRTGSVGWNGALFSFSGGDTPVTGVVSTLLTTVIGETYDFSYVGSKLGGAVASALVQVVANGGTGAVLYTNIITPPTTPATTTFNGSFTATSTSTLIRITDTTPNTTNVDLRIVGTGINFVSRQNVTTSIKFNRVYTLTNGVVTFSDYDLNGALYTPTGTIGDCPVVDNSTELDNSPIDWSPICVSGVQYYFADVMLTDNTTGLATTSTLYKLGDNGVISFTRPVGTITGGYCCLPEPTGEACYTVTETYTLNPLQMLGATGISGSKVYGDTLATISVEASSLPVANNFTDVSVQTGSSGTPVQDRKIKISFSKPVKWQIDFSNIQAFNGNINTSERFYNFSARPDSTVIHPKHQYDVLGNNILGPIDGTGVPTDRSTFLYSNNDGIEFTAGFAGVVGQQTFGNIGFTTTYQRKATVYVDCNGVVTYKDSITGAVVAASLIEVCVSATAKPEIDVDSISWQPMCVNGAQWYWSDVITVDNTAGTYTTVTQYKNGDNGTITTTRPFGVIQLGYCQSTTQVARSHNNFILASGATIPISTGAMSLVVTKTNGIGTINISGTNGTPYPLTFNNESFSQGINEAISSLNAYTITSIGGATAKISEVR